MLLQAMPKESGSWQVNVREQLAGIREQLKSMDERQDTWFKLLQDRIPLWDEGAKTARDLNGRRPTWDYAAVISGFLASGTVIGLIIVGVKYVMDR